MPKPKKPAPMSETHAIAALKALAARWPESLTLVKGLDANGPLKVVATRDTRDVEVDLKKVAALDYIALAVEVSF